MDIFEDSRMVSRADLAAWLRQLADQLDSNGKILFGAAGSVVVAEDVHCELEIERDGTETSIEIEFTWQEAAVTPKADDDEESGEAEEGEPGGETAPEPDSAPETAAQSATQDTEA